MNNNINNMSNVRTNFDAVPNARRIQGNDPLGDAQNAQMIDLSNLPDEQSAIINKNSNYETFLRMVKSMPTIMDILGDLLTVQDGEIFGNFASEDFTNTLMKLFEQTNMPKEDIAKFIKSQVEGSTKFEQPLFQNLRTAMEETNSKEVVEKILNFSKKYNDFASNKHVLNTIVIDLKSMEDYMKSDSRAILQHLVKNIDVEAPLGEVKQNLEVITKQIIPFLGNYIKATNDFGTIRDLITSLVLNTARYENGSKAEVVKTFQNLQGFQIIKKELDDTVSIHDILREVELTVETPKQPIEETFVSLLKMGVEGDAGYENVDTFKQLLANMVMNESVYLPLVHTTLPLNINNTLFFSDLWVDPNDSGKNESEQNNGEQKIKMLFKFEVAELGNFDVIMYMTKQTVDLQVFAPAKIAEQNREISQDIGEIVRQNGFSVGQIQIDKSVKPLSVLEVFKKIYEGKNAINVRI